MANERQDSRSDEMQRLDREVTGNSVNARTAETKRELHEDAERLDRKYSEGNRDEGSSRD